MVMVLFGPFSSCFPPPPHYTRTAPPFAAPRAQHHTTTYPLPETTQVKLAREKAAALKQFGTCDGVIVRCLLNIWGVIMFLRMGFVVSHAGIYQAVLVVFVSLALTVLTATSLSAIATNGEVEGGGAYFLISRSLGAESGGAIGLVFAVANAVSVSMYLIGFSETVVGLYGPGAPASIPANATAAEAAALAAAAAEAGGNYMTTREWDIRIVAFIGLAVIMAVACAGANWVVKIDIGQLVVLIIGILTFFFGACFTTPSFDPRDGLAFTGFNATTFAANWHPDYRPTVVNPQGENFMSIFSVFFPAVTGMMAGANISGELRNAQKSLPFGTMFAVILSNVVYMGIAVILGATCLRDGGQFGGLFGDSMIMIRISLWGPLVIVGIFASTISSALATLVGAPRILKAVCDDGLFPPLQYFAKAREKDNEPIRGYFLTALIAAAGIMIGDLNAIAPLITNFFLATRALINFACFLASYSRSPGWRPTYRMYNKWVSLATAVLCIAVMFAISWWQALVTLCFGAFLYVYIRRATPEVNWGAAELGLKWMQAKKALLHLDKVQLSHHVKTWRPIFLAVPLTFSRHVEPLVAYARQMEHANGFTIVADILVGQFHDLSRRLLDRVQMRRMAGGVNRKDGKKKKQERGADATSVSVDGPKARRSGEGKGGRGRKDGVASAQAGSGSSDPNDDKNNSNNNINKRGSKTGVGKGEGRGGDAGASVDNGGGVSGGDGDADNATTSADESTSAKARTASTSSSEESARKVVRFGVAPSASDIFSAGFVGAADATDVELTPTTDADDSEEQKNIDAPSDASDASDASSSRGNRIEISRKSSMALLEGGVVDLKNVLTETLIARSLVDGVRTMIQTSGVGLMRPNMLMLPTIPDFGEGNFLFDCLERKEDYTDDMCDMVLSGLRFDFGVGMLSAPVGKPSWGQHFINQGSSYGVGCWGTRRRYGDKPSLAKAPAGGPDAADGPIIDVFWVSDTGGCLLLIAYMHSQWNKWSKPCRLVRALLMLFVCRLWWLF